MISCASFRKSVRLRQRADFLRLSAQGRKLHTAHFLILRGIPQTDSGRLGITVTRKVGNAVIRNRIKRLLREFYRCHRELFGQADWVIIAKRGAERLSFATVTLELCRALLQRREEP